jgi:hypothetical protein
VKTGVCDKFGLSRIEDFDFILKHRQELSRTATHPFRDTVTTEQMAALAGGIDTADKPFFIADDNASTGGIGEHEVTFPILKTSEQVTGRASFEGTSTETTWLEFFVQVRCTNQEAGKR